MADLKDVIADSLRSRQAAVLPDEVVRKAEHDADIAARSTTTAVEALITAANHPAVTTPNNQSLILAVAVQSLTGEVKIPSETSVQAAASLTLVSPHAVVAGATINLARDSVTSVVVIRRPAGGGATIATGVVGTDYYLNARSGLVTILTGSNLITASGAQEVYTTYSCPSITTGPDLQVTASGLAVKTGTTRNTVALGDHVHTNDHPALTVAPSSTMTMAVAVDQKLTVEAFLKSGGGITYDGAGLKIDSGVGSLVGHTHANATPSVAGFESAADKTKLDSLSVISVSDTQTVDLTFAAGLITGDVRRATGGGIIADANGIKIDSGVVSQVGHTHANATTSVAGFLSATDKLKIDGMGALIADSTATLTLTTSTVSGLPHITGNVRLSSGISSDANGIKIDSGIVSLVGHTHANASVSVSGFMSAADKVMLLDHETRVDALEAGSLVIDPLTLITDRTATTSIGASDMFLLAQGANAKKITTADVFRYLSTSYLGVYNAGTPYIEGNMVTQSGVASGFSLITGASLFMCRLPNTGQPVTNATYWSIICQAGTPGTSNPTLAGDVSGTALASVVDKIGGITVSPFIKTLVDDSTNAIARTTLGCGTSATYDVSTSGTASATQVVKGNDLRLGDIRTPALHAASHKTGGTDAIKIDELAAGTDITTLNADVSRHGLLRKLSGTTTSVLRGDGTWATDIDVTAVKVSGTQVVAAQQTAISDASVAHSISSYAEVETDLDAMGVKVNAILAALRTHGLIDT